MLWSSLQFCITKSIEASKNCISIRCKRVSSVLHFQNPLTSRIVSIFRNILLYLFNLSPRRLSQWGSLPYITIRYSPLVCRFQNFLPFQYKTRFNNISDLQHKAGLLSRAWVSYQDRSCWRSAWRREGLLASSMNTLVKLHNEGSWSDSAEGNDI